MSFIFFSLFRFFFSVVLGLASPSVSSSIGARIGMRRTRAGNFDSFSILLVFRLPLSVRFPSPFLFIRCPKKESANDCTRYIASWDRAPLTCGAAALSFLFEESNQRSQSLSSFERALRHPWGSALMWRSSASSTLTSSRERNACERAPSKRNLQSVRVTLGD